LRGELRGEFNTLSQCQDSHFRWLMGTMIALFMGFGGAILTAVKL
jgi:hypothetical protein